MNVSKIVPMLLFLLVSLLSFSVWAFGSRLFPNEPTMYAGCAVVFLGLGGASLLPTSGLNSREAIRFCVSFAVAFSVYAVIWSVAWFSLPNTMGEIFGSSLGLAAMAAILIRWNRWALSLLVATAILFFFHTLGYYIGGFLYQTIGDIARSGATTPEMSAANIRLLARLSWGLGYGLGLGWGLSHLLHLSRQSSASPSTQI